MLRFRRPRWLRPRQLLVLDGQLLGVLPVGLRRSRDIHDLIGRQARGRRCGRQSHRRAVEQIEQAPAIAHDDLPTRGDLRVARRVAIPLQDIPQLRHGDPIVRLQPDVRGRGLERDFRRLHSGDLHESHTHGVGADLSIHAEDVQLHTPQLRRRRRRREQQERESRRGDDSHVPLHYRSQKK
jgi:hypothetical protein